MKPYLLFSLIIMSVSNAHCQTAPEKPYLNLEIEESAPNQLPHQWIKWGNQDYQVMSDSSQAYQGNFALATYSNEDAGEQSFGSGAFRIPANYEGRQIELKGRMKLENVQDGFAGLLLRIDGDGRPLAFDNMQSRNLQGSTDWQEYIITLPFPEGATQIYLGGLLTGKGKAWFDDFKVSIDGKDISTLEPVVPKFTLAEQDHEFDEGSRIEEIQLSKENIETLALMGKVWGLMKYYHPKLAEGDINWDYALFRFLPNMLEAKDWQVKNKLILEWVNELGPFETEKTAKKRSEQEIKLEADLAWIDQQDRLSEEVKDKLRQLSRSKSPEEHYYIGLAPGVGNPLFKHENAYNSMRYPDTGIQASELVPLLEHDTILFPLPASDG